MLTIEENISAINFCEFFIGYDKTEIKFSLVNFLIEEGNGTLLLGFNSETRPITIDNNCCFSVININQIVTLSVYYSDKIQHEKKFNIIEIIRLLDVRQIISSVWIDIFKRESTDFFEYTIKISILLSEFNKKQLIDIKLRSLLAVHNRIEQIEIEKNDNPLKKKTKLENKKKTANVVYSLMVQDPSTVSPLRKPEVIVKPKINPKPKVVCKTSEETATEKPPPEFEFQAKVDCAIQ